MSESVWQVGDTVADLYQIREINTEGGMSLVYFVWHLGWQMELAIKSPRVNRAAMTADLDRFSQEAETWSEFGLHPNIVTAYYVRRIDDMPRIMLEKINGGSLKTWLARGRIRDLATALDIAIQVASGLRYAQTIRPGFVHRDIKPANILMTPEGEAKLTDFGLAGARRSFGGTPAYIAPEIWLEHEIIDTAADLYAFGVVLFELLTGRRPFEMAETGESLGERPAGVGVEVSLGGQRHRQQQSADQSQYSLGDFLEHQRVSDLSLGNRSSLATDANTVFARYRELHCQAAPPSPLLFNPQIPPQLANLCLRLLSKDRRDRDHSVDDVLRELKEVYRNATGATYARETPGAAELLADSLNNRALSMLDLHQVPKAVAAWRRSSAANPTHLETVINLGRWEWEQGHIDDVEYLKRLEALSEIHIERPEYRGAVEHARRARGDDADLLEQLASSEGQNSAETLFDLKHGPRFGALHSVQLPVALHAITPLHGSARVLAVGKDHLVRAVDLTTGDCVHVVPVGDVYERFALAAMSDGHTYIFTVGMNSYELQVWDDKQRKFIATLWPDIGKRERRGGSSVTVINVEDADASCWGASCFSFSDGECLLAAGYRGEYGFYQGLQPFAVWNTRDWSRLTTVFAHRQAVYALALSASGEWLVSGGGGADDDNLKLWNLASGKCIRRFIGHSGHVAAITLLNEDRFLLSGGKDGTVRLWNVATGTLEQIFRGHRDEVMALAIVPGQPCFASAAKDGSIKIWDLDTAKCIRTLEGHIGAVTSLVVLAGENQIFELLSAGADKTVRRWYGALAKTPPFSYLLSTPTSGAAQQRKQSQVLKLLQQADEALDGGDAHNGHQLLRQAQAVPGYERASRVLNRLTQSALATPSARRVGVQAAWLVGKLSGHQGAVTGLTWLKDFVVSVGSDKTIRVWDRENRTAGRTIPHNVTLSDVVVAGQRLITSSKDAARNIKLQQPTLLAWDLSSSAVAHDFHGHREGVSCLAASKDCRWLISGGWSREGRKSGQPVVVWEIGAADSVKQLSGHIDNINDVAISDNGRLAVSASTDRTARLWSVAEGSCLQVFSGHRFGVFAAALSADGSQVLTGGADNEVCLWNARTGECIRSLLGHEETIHCVAFVPRSQFALSAGDDGEVRLWNLSTGDCLHVFVGHTDAILSLALSSDGRRFATGSFDKTINLWEIDWQWSFPSQGEVLI